MSTSMASPNNSLTDTLPPYNPSTPTAHKFTGVAETTNGYNALSILLSAPYPVIIRVYQAQSNVGVWNDIQIFNYPSSDAELGVSIYRTVMVKTTWFKVEVENVSGYDNLIYLQTMKINSTTGTNNYITVNSLLFPADSYIGITGAVGVSGLYNGLVGVTGEFNASLTVPQGTSIGITGMVGVSGMYKGLVGVTGSSVITVPANTFIGITGMVGVSGFYNGLVGVTGSSAITVPANTFIGITGMVGVSGFYNGLVGVTGSSAITVPANTFIGITGMVGVSGFYNGLVGVTGSSEITVPANTFIGITGMVGVSGFYNGLVGVTGSSVITVPANTHIGITGIVGVSGFYNGLVGVTGSSAITVPANTFIGITGMVGVSGFYNGLVGITGSSAITVPANTFIGITGMVGVSGFYNGLVGITGSSAITVPANTHIGITGIVGVSGMYNGLVGVTGANFPSYFGITGMVPVLVAGNDSTGTARTIYTDVNGLVGITGYINAGITGSAYSTLTTIETDISSGVLMKGDDGTGLRTSIYTDEFGVQRTQNVPLHLDTAKYIFSTDCPLITTPSLTGWSLDERGRQGWYYTGGGSQLKWYGNQIFLSTNIEVDDIDCIWMVVCGDSIFNPELRVITTGSTIVYSPQYPSSIFLGETYLYYYGEKALRLNPGISPRLLTRTVSSGSGAGTITSISISGGTHFLVSSAGIASSTGLFDLGQLKVTFDNNNDYIQQQKLMQLSFDASSNVKSTITGQLTSEGNYEYVSATLARQRLYAGGIPTRYALATDSLIKGESIVDGTSMLEGILPGMYNVTAEITSTNVKGIPGQNRVGLTTLVDNPATYPANTYDICMNVNGVLFTGLDANGKRTPIKVDASGVNTYINNASTTVNRTIFGATGATAGINTNTGINTYSIPIKQKQLVISGSTGTSKGVLAGANSTFTIGVADWGITKPKIFSIFMNATSVAKTFFYDYVDTKGNERTGTLTVPTVNAWHQLPLQSGFTEQMVGINNVRVSASLLENDAYFIAFNADLANTVCSGIFGRTYNAVITIPNNAIGYVSNVMMSNAANNYFNLWKYDAITGARSNIFYYPTVITVNHAAAGYEGSLGGLLKPGEAVLGSIESASNMVLFGNVVIKYLS